MAYYPTFVPKWLRRVREYFPDLRIWVRPTSHGGWEDPWFALVVDRGHRDFPSVVTEGKLSWLREEVRWLEKAIDLLPRVAAEEGINISPPPVGVGGPWELPPRVESDWLRALIALGQFLETGEERALKEVPFRARIQGFVDLWHPPEETDQEMARERVKRFRERLQIS